MKSSTGPSTSTSAPASRSMCSPSLPVYGTTSGCTTECGSVSWWAGDSVRTTGLQDPASRGQGTEA